jgi:hypothetical protein
VLNRLRDEFEGALDAHARQSGVETPHIRVDNGGDDEPQEAERRDTLPWQVVGLAPEAFLHRSTNMLEQHPELAIFNRRVDQD